MNKPLPLEDFDLMRGSFDRATAREFTEAEVEQVRLAAYEGGYSAGWDDALKEAGADQDRIEGEFARNLEDLGFTFHEARNHVLGSLEPLLQAVVDTVLPEVVQGTLGHAIQEEILSMAEKEADAPIQLRVAPGNRRVVERLLDHTHATPLELHEDDTLSDGQVFLRSDTTERCIDLTSALARIKDAVGALYDIKEKAFHHG